MARSENPLLQWKPTLNDDDIQTMDICLRIQLLATQGNDALNSAHKQVGLHAGEFDILATLFREPAPQTAATLRSRLLLSKAGMSARLTRLKDKGWVLESDSPYDGRSKVLSLTEDGSSALHAALPQHLEAENGLLGALNSSEKKSFLSLLQKIQGDFSSEK